MQKWLFQPGVVHNVAELHTNIHRSKPYEEFSHVCVYKYVNKCITENRTSITTNLLNLDDSKTEVKLYILA